MSRTYPYQQVQVSRTKSTSRDTAERSLRGALGTAAVIASTHLIPVEEEDPDIQADLKSLPASTQLMIALTAAAWGCPVYPIDPAFIYSTDDTTEYFKAYRQQFSQTIGL